MKLLKKNISAKNGEGSVKLRAEEAEDMWHAYHLIGHGDRVRTSTLRKVIKEGATGSVTSQKIKITLTIEVQRTSFDAEGCTLHLAGVNVEESAHVRLGAAHTLHLELHRDFTLDKDCWDRVAMDRLDLACDPARSADVAAICLEPGLAWVCLISGHLTITRAKVEVVIPKKRGGVQASQHSKAVARFHAQLASAVMTHIDLEQIKCVLVGSPGFAAADFLEALFGGAAATKAAAAASSSPHAHKALLAQRGKFVVCKASCGHKRAIAEMLASPAVGAQLTETKAVADVVAFERFTKMLQDDPDRAYYGYKHVCFADRELAIDTLLVTDTLFKACDVDTRKKYVALTESVASHGGKVLVFSSLHVSGEQLAQVSGIAAVLRYPLPEDTVLGGDDEYEDDGGGDDDDEEEEQGGVSALNGVFTDGGGGVGGGGVEEEEEEEGAQQPNSTVNAAANDLADMGL